QNFTVLPPPISATLDPGIAATLISTDTQGLPTRLAFPAGAVGATATAVLTPTVVKMGGGDLFTGAAFDLTVSRNRATPPGLSFGARVVVTVRCGDADVRAVSHETELALRWWNGSGWTDAAATCAPPSTYDRNTTSNLLRVSICRTGRYALFGPTHHIFLPLN